MKVTMILGEPAVGKSTMMRKFLGYFDPTFVKKIPYVTWHESQDGKVIVLGDYSNEGHPYPGTDRLSMACQPRVIELIFTWKSEGKDAVLFEGDRLGNDSMIKSLQYCGVDFQVVALTNNQLPERQAARTAQSNSFKSSRRTKLRNMLGPYGRMARTGLKPVMWDITLDSQSQACARWLWQTRTQESRQ